MAKMNPHLQFNGRCLEALRFYEKCFNGKINFSMTWGESPMGKEVSSEWAEKIIHASMEFDGQVLSADDAPPGHYAKPQGFQVLVSYQDIPQAERVFKALAEGGDIKMPFAQTFWAVRFGMVVDRFGTPWMINCEGAQ